MAPKPPKESPPVLHSAIPGQGLYSIGDASGNRRWIGSGREVNGWKVGDYNRKSNTLKVSKGDRTEYLQMGSGSISDYTPPMATPDAKTIAGKSLLSEAEQALLDNGGYPQEGYTELDHQRSLEDAMRMRNQFTEFMKKQVPTATPVPEPAATQEVPKTYLTQDAYGQIQRQYYIGDLPDDAIPDQEEK